jgi:hypothetical protein
MCEGGCEVFGRARARLRIEGTVDAGLEPRGLETVDVNVLIQLVEDVLAVSRRCDGCEFLLGGLRG